MLLYVYGESFPGQTYVLQADSSYSVLRVKAQLLHLVRPLGIPSVTFDLTLRDEPMSEGLLLSDYGIFGKTDLGMIVYEGDPAAEAETAELLTLEIRELSLLSRLSLLVKSCAVVLVAMSMAAFFSDWGVEMTWNFVHAVALLAATWKSRTLGLKMYMAMLPLVLAGNMYVQFDYWLSPSGRCVRELDGRLKWYCVPLTNALLALMVPLQVVALLATLRFLKNLRFYPGMLFEKRLMRARTLQAMLLSARSKDPEVRRVAAKALARHANESFTNARRLVEEKILFVLRDLARTGDDNIKYHVACTLNGLAGDDHSHPTLIAGGYLKDTLKLAHHKSDAVCGEAASALLRFTYEPNDLSAVVDTPGVVGTIRAIAMAREGEVQYYAKVAHDNIDKFQAEGGGGYEDDTAAVEVHRNL